MLLYPIDNGRSTMNERRGMSPATQKENAKKKDVEAFVKDVESYIGKSEKMNADAVLQVSMSANYELYEKVRRENTMCEALRRLMKDEIEETLDKATKEAARNGLEEGIAKGQAQTQRKTSIALSKMGMSIENIASAVDATIAQVQSWINGNDIETAETVK